MKNTNVARRKPSVRQRSVRPAKDSSSSQNRLAHSMQLQDRLRFETLLADISSRFVSVPADGIDAEIHAAQREICNCLGVEHSSVWQVSPEDPANLMLTHVVRDPGLPPPPMRMTGTELFPWAQSKLVNKELVCLPDVSKAPREAARDLATWQAYGIKSTVGIPLSAGGGPVFGVLSFEGTSTTRKWPKELLGRLQVLADVFANALARRQAELKLRESEARVTLAAESANAGLWTLNPATGEVWASDVTYGLFGFHPGEPFTLERLFSVVHPPHRDSIQQAIESALLRPEGTSVEYRIQRTDGSERWMSSRGRRHSSNGKPPFVLMGVTADITLAKQLERDRVMLTRKLLRAQELECARIARELHDDLGQFIALFSVQLHEAVKQLEKESSDLGSPLRELYGKAGEIAHRVSTISHHLHSSELDLLGLVGAAKHYCREVSDAHGIKIAFSSDRTHHKKHVEIDLCMFRVLQEAVNNAVRHSRARKISVQLRQGNNRVSLLIEDDGIGFNAGRPKRKRGLGLVSMSERLRLLGGEFALRSVPGRGTTIEAAVPLSANGNG